MVFSVMLLSKIYRNYKAVPLIYAAYQQFFQLRPLYAAWDDNHRNFLLHFFVQNTPVHSLNMNRMKEVTDSGCGKYRFGKGLNVWCP